MLIIKLKNMVPQFELLKKLNKLTDEVINGRKSKFYV